MDRRRFLKVAATGAVGAAALTVAGCEQAGVMAPGQLEGAVAEDSSLPEIEWQMATSWPPALDTIFGGAETVAQRVEAMTQGKFKIEARAAGELAPGLEVLNVVEEGAVPIGHTASYYYIGKSPITAFGTALPFGLTSRQQDAWLYEGGGLEMLQTVYAENLTPSSSPPATPACRWAAGSIRRSTPSPTWKASRCASPASAAASWTASV